LTVERAPQVRTSGTFGKAADIGAAGTAGTAGAVGTKAFAAKRTPENRPAHPQQIRALSLFGVWHASQYLVISKSPWRPFDSRARVDPMSQPRANGSARRSRRSAGPASARPRRVASHAEARCWRAHGTEPGNHTKLAACAHSNCRCARAAGHCPSWHCPQSGCQKFPA